MKGLLIKDFMLMKQQKVSFMMIAFISIVLLPLRLKYGCVNSAAAIMLAMTVVFTAMVLLSGGSGDFLGKKAYAVENIESALSFKLLFLFVFVACAGFIASYFISKRIVEHKEF